MLREAAHAAIGLIVPERKIGAVGQVFGEVDETAAQTASIDFLQADDIVVAEERRDGIEILEAFAVRQRHASSSG